MCGYLTGGETGFIVCFIRIQKEAAWPTILDVYYKSLPVQLTTFLNTFYGRKDVRFDVNWNLGFIARLLVGIYTGSPVCSYYKVRDRWHRSIKVCHGPSTTSTCLRPCIYHKPAVDSSSAWVVFASVKLPRFIYNGRISFALRPLSYASLRWRPDLWRRETASERRPQ